MRNFLKFFLFVAIIMLTGCAGSSQYMRKATPVEELSSGESACLFHEAIRAWFCHTFPDLGSLSLDRA